MDAGTVVCQTSDALVFVTAGVLVVVAPAWVERLKHPNGGFRTGAADNGRHDMGPDDPFRKG